MFKKVVFIFVTYFSVVKTFPHLQPQKLMADSLSDGSMQVPPEAIQCAKPRTSDIQHRWHVETKSCQMLYRQGPCPSNMWIVPDFKVDKYLGECECKKSLDAKYVYHAATNQCYALYTQAYCAPSEWLININETTDRCEQNPCLDHDPNSVLFKGECIAVDEPHPSCPSDQKIGFPAGKLRPGCVEQNQKFHLLSLLQGNQCQEGGRQRRFSTKCPRAMNNTTDEI